MALREELVQRIKTVAESDSTPDDDDVMSYVVFEPSITDPDLGQVQIQRVDPDRLPPARQHNPPEKKPPVATPMPGEGRPAARAGDRAANGGPAVRPISVPRRPAQLVLCINKYGEKQGELKDPLGVACLPGGEIVVSEWGNRRLQVFDVNGRSLRLIAPGTVNLTSLVSSLTYRPTFDVRKQCELYKSLCIRFIIIRHR